MVQLVPNLARGGRGVRVGDSCVGVKFVFGAPFFCLTWPMNLPEIFESSKKIDLDPLPRGESFNFSLCFQTRQLSMKSITFPTRSRSPRGLAYISSYSA